ncbi:AMP-binding protein [Niabella ginsengisoli]|uniref:AMP-binding protein n=1 Tax=Niabella ginsengisoli TaxID=522298 RepID=UPI0021D4639F|nr:AMP-binding protein [Niabella ginsengisoli]
MGYPEYRLFDAVAHQLTAFPKTNMLNAKENGQWRSHATKDVADIVNRLSAGLLAKGVSGKNFTPEGSDKIAIISNNRPEWVFADLAVQQIGAILVPMYPTTSPAEMEYILKESEAKYIFVSNEELLEKVRSLNSDSLKGIYTFDEVKGAAHYTELLALASPDLLEQVESAKKQIPNSHVATIIYTSGTTGTPKGVMLSHSNIVSNIFFRRLVFRFPTNHKQKHLAFYRSIIFLKR